MATQTEVARHLDLSERQINNLQKLPGFPKPQGRGGYELDACRMFYIRYLRAAKTSADDPEMDGDGTGEQSLDREKQQLANDYRREQIEMLRFKRAVLAKEYAPISVLTDVLAQWCTAARTNVDGWLPQLKMIWPDVPHHVITLFRTKIAELMNELANVQINPDDYSDSDIESGFAHDIDLEDADPIDRGGMG